jgi:hypothetical protein
MSGWMELITELAISLTLSIAAAYFFSRLSEKPFLNAKRMAGA